MKTFLFIFLLFLNWNVFIVNTFATEITTDSQEPVINKIQFSGEIKAFTKATLSGKNLENTTIWCGNFQISTENYNTNTSDFSIPDRFLSCNLEVRKGSTKHNMNYKLEYTPLITIHFLEFNTADKIIKAKGIDFYKYKDSLSQLKLTMYDSELSTIFSSPKFISDKEISFTHNRAVPIKGNAILELGKIKTPPIQYEYKGEKIAKVMRVSDPSILEDGNISFGIETTVLLNDEENKDIKILLNKKVQQGINDRYTLDIQQKTLPAKTGTAWIEKDNFKGNTFYYKINNNVSPFIKSIKTISPLNQSGGKILIKGFHFKPEKQLKVSSNASSKFEIKDVSNSEFTTHLPYKIKDGKYNIAIQTQYGKSANIEVIVPSKANEIFYSTPKIDSISFPFGAFPKKTIEIKGSGFTNTTSINFNDKKYKVDTVTAKKITAIIPSDVDRSGKVSVSVQYKNISNEKEYLIENEPEIKNIQFALKTSLKAIESKEEKFQDLFELEVKNTKESITVKKLEFKLQCNKKDSCGNKLPFTELQVTDEKGKTIKGSHVWVDINNSSIFLKNISIPVSSIPIKFYIQAKAFKKLKKNEAYAVKLYNAILQSSLNNKSIPTELNKENIVISYIQANKEVFEKCIIKIEKKWEKCTYTNTQATTQEISQNTSPSTTQNQTSPSTTTSSTTQINSNTTSSPSSNSSQTTQNTFSISVPQKNYTKKLSFKDMSNKDWFYSPVEKLYQRGILNGYADGTFDPAGNINRAELLKMVLVSRGESEWGNYATVHFEDTENHWSKNLLEYALEKKYIKEGTKFQPLKKVTRSESMKLLCKMFPSALTEKETDTHFIDLKNHWSKTCVMAAYDAGIIKGTSSLRFSPNNNLTRAEFAKILDLILEKI